MRSEIFLFNVIRNIKIRDQRDKEKYLKDRVDGLVTWELIWLEIDLNAVEVAWENNVEGLFGVAGNRLCCWPCCWLFKWLFGMLWFGGTPGWLTWFPIITLFGRLILLKKPFVPLLMVSSIEFVFVEPRMDGRPLVKRFKRFGWLNEFAWFDLPPGKLL